MASYINYDYAKEFLVYAHAGPGIKTALSQIEEISRRTTDGLAIAIGYDDKTTYPYWWYLRNYPNKVYYGTEPTRALRDSPVIAVGDTNYQKIEPVVGQGYYQFDYIRLWWPNQDYYDLTWERILFALRDPQMRAAIFQIWLNRDYSLYGEITNKQDTTNLAGWYPSARMRLYIRKDLAAKLWNYGIGPQEEAAADPYATNKLEITSDRILGSPGNAPGQFQRPRDLVVAPDGSLYVADTDNHRIQHLDANGAVLQTWGSFADLSKGPAPGGTFFEPWGIALGLDGSIYVADTWNHRIQKFTADGEFITMWGYFGQAEAPEALWGPRDVAVDSQGRVYVTDTGNKRIVVFDADGKPVTQFGSVGLELGQFDEPVGVALGPEDQVYVADTWNQRVQVFIQDSVGNFTPLNSWDIAGWYGQSLDNKPFLAADSQGNVFVTDPEAPRVLEFNNEGVFTRYWGDYSTGPDGFGLAGSVAPDGQGGVWVSDAGNNRIMHFALP
jgi:DNA-binding beta-propeller fold protein YncE